MNLGNFGGKLLLGVMSMKMIAKPKYQGKGQA